MRFLFVLFFLIPVLKAGAQPHAFKGFWITNTEDVKSRPAPLFRKEFELLKPVKRANLYVCGVGYNLTTVNGGAVTKAVLEQAFTKYDSRLSYMVYDVTGLITKGKNCLGVELGNSWLNMQSATLWGFNRIGWRKTPRLLLDLVLEYTDGTVETIFTDASWKWGTGGSQFNGMYAGEIYDARKEAKGWNIVGFTDSLWNKSMISVSPGGALEEQSMPSVQIIKRIKPVSLKKPAAGIWLFDMGENFAGVATIRLKGKAGDTVKMRFEESLDSDGRLSRKRNSSHLILDAGDPEFQTDIYVLKGDGIEIFTPRFTYHGFQYVEIETPVGMKLHLSSLEGLFYSTGFQPAGSFESSDLLLNKMYQASLRTYRSNYNSIPMDCPQREKMGWTADAHLAAEMGLWNYDVLSSYKKYLKDIRDVQLPDGRLSGVAPIEGIGYSWIDPQDKDFGPAWGSAMTLISWYLYLYEADTSVLDENYFAIKKYTDMLIGRSEGNLYLTGIADWLAPVATPKAITSTGYYYQDLLLLSKISAVLGKKEDAEYYGQLAVKVKEAYHVRFFDLPKGGYKDSTATSLSTPLVQDLVFPEFRMKVTAALAKRVRATGYTAEFGMMGAKYILKALSDGGYTDDAYRLLTNPGKNGWAYSITNGATTFYEHWTGEASLNHVWQGIFTDWLFKSVAGFQPDENAPGFKHFFIKPVFPKGLKWIKAKHLTRYGEIAIGWRRKGRDILLNVVVPMGTTADLILEGAERKLAPGSHLIKTRMKTSGFENIIKN